MKKALTHLFLPLLVFFMACSDTPGNRTITTEIKPGWKLGTELLGNASGETGIEVCLPKAGDNQPVVFGIPLGQVPSSDEVALEDETGANVPAAVFPLGNRETQPSRWMLIACTLDADKDSARRRLTVRWGDKPGRKAAPQMTHTVEGSTVTVHNTAYGITLSPKGIVSLTSGGGSPIGDGAFSSLIPRDEAPLTTDTGEVSILYDSPRYKRFRFVSQPADSLEIHQEYEVFAGSPYIRRSVRYVNRSVSDIHLDGIIPLDMACAGNVQCSAGIGGGEPVTGERVSIHQRAFDCFASVDGKRAVFTETPGSTEVWIALRRDNGPGVLVAFPYFRGMAPGEDGLESVLSFEGGRLRLHHYRRIERTADVRLRESMARTFTHWLIVDPPHGKEKGTAAAAAHPPYVVYDRGHLTAMGVFQETTVSHLFDSEATEGALYFLRARIPRPEYPRSGRGTEPGPDKSGEGMYEPNLHAGGMVFGEVYQYFTPKPGEALFRQYHDELGFDSSRIITGGLLSYRNGDIPLALFQQYLRSGDESIRDLAVVHTQLYADYGVGHAIGPGNGIGHYYCDWYVNPYVYQRFEGLLLGYLVTGELWWLESAREMADFCVRAWKDGHPRDASMYGVYGMVQSRSAYIAKMLLRLYDMTGEKQYTETAVRLAEWTAGCQEPEGWWVMRPNLPRDEERAFRCTPIFSGYICQGLWPLYHRTKHPELETSLLRAAEWYMEKQEDARGSNPGTFPNSYWYGTRGSENEPQPVSGNYATTSHTANILLQAYLATGRRDFFYGANAAWVGVLNHQNAEGGIPLENTAVGSVWSHVLVESLPAFGATAEHDELPVVLSAKTGVPGTSFMGKGANFDGREFTFELKYRAENTLPIRVYLPFGMPSSVEVDGSGTADYTFDGATNVLTLFLAPGTEFTTCRIAVRRGD